MRGHQPLKKEPQGLQLLRSHPWHGAFAIGPLPIVVTLDMELKLAIDIGFKATAELVAEHTGHLSSGADSYMGVQYHRNAGANNDPPKGWSRMSEAATKEGQHSISSRAAVSQHLLSHASPNPYIYG